MKHLFPKILLPIVIGIALCGAAGCELSGPRPPEAIQGVLDLRGWNFESDGPVDLTGEYEFYWQRHLLPAAFSHAPAPDRSGYIPVPEFWNGYRLDGLKLPGQGFATYRLTVLLTKPREPLALEIREISTAYVCFLDQTPVIMAGAAGATSDTTVPGQFPAVVPFRPESDRVAILLQVSNFHHRRGGLWDRLRLGTESQIRREQALKHQFDFFILGGIAIMAVYHLSLFIVRRKFRPTLYFGIGCFLMALRLLTTDERYLVQLVPNLDWSLLIKLEYLTFYLAVPAFGLFLRSLFPQLNRWLLRAVLAIGLASSAGVLVTPPAIFTHTLPYYEVFTLILFVYTFGLLLSKPARQQFEAFLLIAGMLVFGLTVLNDMLHVERVIRTAFLAPFGLLVFIFSQAFLLSFRLIKAFTLVESRGVELRQALKSLKQEMHDRIRVEEALREGEEKYRTILNSIQEGYYEITLRGDMMFCNDSLCRIIGYARDELIGMSNRQYMSAEAGKRAYEMFLRVYNTGEATEAFDWEVITKDGTRKTVEASLTLMRDVKGVPTGFRGVVRDITERKRAEEQTKLHQQQMMQASKMAALGVLVSGVAHEINNPNNFIMLNAPILREAWQSALPILEEYYKENGDFLMAGMKYSEMRQHMPQLLAGVSQGAERIKQIVANLKTYVRGNPNDLTQPVDVNAVIRSSISLVSNVIRNATDHFEVDYGPGLPRVRGSFQRLEQVILNLIQNACQALPDRERGIFVTTERDGQGSNVLIVIRDEGAGIHPEALPRIREPFFTTKQDSGGIGLGLSISSKIVEEHRGRLHIASAPGAGTTATITLPADAGTAS
ncbi:MAG: PAS domain S-box protein [Deltaproteobacteria bacterium]|nr:PAS domain S-box protein [Deltaproteobacteria bacterium]